MIRKRSASLPAALLCLVLIPWAGSIGRTTDLNGISAQDSILIVSPHPDDESLCCGGLVSTARAKGAAVSIVWVTSGDGFKWAAIVAEKTLRPRGGAFHELARQRIGEARAAADILGVPRESQYFLGYPDRGVLPLLFDYYEKNWRSKFTGENAVPFMDAFRPGATYEGKDLVHDFSTLVDRIRPTLVLAPSPRDTHPDHRGTGLLAMRVMEARRESNTLRFWIVHGGHRWPTPRAFRPQLPLPIAPRGADMQWHAFAVDEAARSTKREAIAAHRTQTRVMGRVMLSYVRATELFSKTPTGPNDTACLKAAPCGVSKAQPSEGGSL